MARLPELQRLGVAVIFVGNAPAAALAAFVGRMALADRSVTVVTDPSLAAFQAAGLRRPRLPGLRAIGHLLRELAAGYAPGRVIGDGRQLGGALLIDDGGHIVAHYRSRSPGDLVDGSDIVHAALALLVEQRAAERRV